MKPTATVFFFYFGHLTYLILERHEESLKQPADETGYYCFILPLDLSLHTLTLYCIRLLQYHGLHNVLPYKSLSAAMRGHGANIK